MTYPAPTTLADLRRELNRAHEEIERLKARNTELEEHLGLACKVVARHYSPPDRRLREALVERFDEERE